MALCVLCNVSKMSADARVLVSPTELELSNTVRLYMCYLFAECSLSKPTLALLPWGGM